MIEKPKRPKKIDIQERQPPRTLQELINRYDLDNIQIYDYLDKVAIAINDIIDRKVTKTTIITEAGTDLDDYTEEGTYYFSSSYTPLNIPAGVNGWLVVMRSTGAVKQIWYRFGSAGNHDNTFVRTCNSGTWLPWKQYQIVEDSGWITPTLINGTATSNNNYKCQYRKINGIVYIRGVITTLTGTGQLFELSAGYRPVGIARFITNTGNTASASNVIRIGSGGQVSLQNTSNTGTFEITLDGISFVADN